MKKVALIAGKPSHGYGAHEHKAGCMLLAEALNAANIESKPLFTQMAGQKMTRFWITPIRF